jgi:hypothetical protein
MGPPPSKAGTRASEAARLTFGLGAFNRIALGWTKAYPAG